MHLAHPPGHCTSSSAFACCGGHVITVLGHTGSPTLKSVAAGPPPGLEAFHTNTAAEVGTTTLKRLAPWAGRCTGLAAVLHFSGPLYLRLLDS